MADRRYRLSVVHEIDPRALVEGGDGDAVVRQGAGEIGVAAFVSTLCICIVFVPMFFLTGVSRFLFVPMALSVMFAMIWSFILSRTLVPKLGLNPRSPGEWPWPRASQA